MSLGANLKSWILIIMQIDKLCKSGPSPAPWSVTASNPKGT